MMQIESISNNTLLKSFAEVVGLPISVFKGKTLTTVLNPKIQDYNLPLYIASSLPKDLPKAFSFHTPEFIFCGGLQIDATDELILVCPAFATECSLTRAKKILARLGRSYSTADAFCQTLNSIPRCDVIKLSAIIKFLSTLLNNESDIEIESLEFHWTKFFDVDDYTVITSTNDSITYLKTKDTENMIISYIRNGKVHELTNFFNQQLIVSNMTDTLLTDIGLKKSYLIGANMIFSRTAKDAGVDYDLINTLNDYFIEIIDNTNSRSDLSYVFYQMITRYATEVSKLLKHKSHSPVVNQVNSYVHAHLYDKLSTSIIAEGITMSVSHLCAEFKKETGTTITEFITECKIEEAKVLLKQNHASCNEISDLLCFSSRSYFNKIFKNQTGLTPKEWQNQN